MARFMTAALALIALVATGTSLYLWNALQAERAISRSALERAPVSSADAVRMSEPGVPAPPAADASPTSAERESSTAAPPQTAGTPAEKIPPEAQAAWRRMREQLSDPQARAALVRRQVSTMIRTNPDLGDALGLDEAGVERFLTTLVEGSMREMERRLDSGNAGSAQSPMVAAAEARRINENVIESEYGSDVLAKWREYEASMPARLAVRGVQMRLADADLALSKDQRQQMMTVYSRVLSEFRPPTPAESSRAASSSSSGAGGWPSQWRDEMLETTRREVETAPLIHARIEQEARNILTADQQAELVRLLREDLETQREWYEAMNNARMEPSP